MMASSSSPEQEGAIRTWLGHHSSGSKPRRRRMQEENNGLELGAVRISSGLSGIIIEFACSKRK
jgi:hypothetical protein